MVPCIDESCSELSCMEVSKTALLCTDLSCGVTAVVDRRGVGHVRVLSMLVVLLADDEVVPCPEVWMTVPPCELNVSLLSPTATVDPTPAWTSPLSTLLPVPSTAPSPLMMSPWFAPPTATAPSPRALVLSPSVTSPMPKLRLRSF